jgi:hypothetical protein
MKEYLIKSYNQQKEEQKEFYLSDIPIFLLEKIPSHLDISNIIEDVREAIPYEFYSSLEGIYIGSFKELEDRKVQAIFKDGVIYLSSYKNFPNVDHDSVVSHLIHEIGHLVEDDFYNNIYGDQSIEVEYLFKKKRLLNLLKSNGISFPSIGNLFFSDDRVDEFDRFLYKDIGYDNLAPVTVGLFTSPYSVTTLREYFANGFEEYFIGDEAYLKEVSPQLFNKIKTLINNVKEY